MARQKRVAYHERRVDANYGVALRGFSHKQLNKQRGLKGTTLGPANAGRRLSRDERLEVERQMRERGEI